MEVNQRRFVFSLRMLLAILTVTCGLLGWTGWQSRMVAHRKTVARSLEARYGTDFRILWEDTEFSEGTELLVAGNKAKRISWFRRWLGDKNAQALLFNHLPVTNDAREAFPEADICMW